MKRSVVSSSQRKPLERMKLFSSGGQGADRSFGGHIASLPRCSIVCEGLLGHGLGLGRFLEGSSHAASSLIHVLKG